MALSDDVTNLEAALTTARSASIAPADVVKLLDVAILKPVVEGGKIYASYSIGGRTVTIAIRDAQELRKYYNELAREDAASGGLIPTFAQFVSPE